MFARLGAVVFDADELARRAVERDTPGWEAVVRRFGPAVLDPHHEIDRARLADIVFGDPAARHDLAAIVHPEVFRLLEESLARHRDTDSIVVFDAPLIIETGFHALCDVVVVVTASAETRVRRLVEERGLDEIEARRRMDAQTSEQEREAVADVVIRNDGPLEDLEDQVGAVWADLTARAGRARGRGR